MAIISTKNNKDLISLALGPMSSEVIEAVFRYSNFYRKPLMLVASKNQIDHSGGYVNNWTTNKYMEFVNGMRKQNPNAEVKICRDHCGPGFNGNSDISDTYTTIEDDIKCGFDLIHIDFCHFQGTNNERLEAMRRAILHCINLKPSILIEIGTDENIGTNYGLPNLTEWEREIEFFKGFCNPCFYVVQTGSLIKEINQAGSFNRPFVEKVAKILKKKGLKLKEHNADYLSKDEISLRRGVVDALNVAPQLGVIQTQIILTKCLVYGIPINKFLEEVYRGGKWKKWMHKNTSSNEMLCSIIAGHYHFTSPSYSLLIKELAKREDIKETIINVILEVIHHYVQK